MPKVSIADGWVVIEIDTPSLLAQEADYQKTVALCEKGKYEEAKPILQKLIDKNPTHSEYHRIMGQILSDQGNQDEAINCLIDALRWNSKNANALLMMGNIFAKFKNDIPTALLYYNQVLVVQPKDYITLSNIAYILFKEGTLFEAKKFANETLKIQANYPNALFILGLIAEKENASHTAFEFAILAIKYSEPSEPLYSNALQQAIAWATQLSQNFEGEKVMQSYRSQLEAEGGIDIEIEKDDTLSVAAKIEFAERYNRDHHLVKYKGNYPAVAHLVMHEMMHLDFVIQAKKVHQNQLFLSTQQNKNSFLKGFQSAIEKLKKQGLPQENIQQFTDGVFNGLNLQTYNTPIDLFIEASLFYKYEKLRPYQFLSLYRLIQESIQAVTHPTILEIVPSAIVSKSKIYGLVHALQFRELFGVHLLDNFQASQAEMQQAQAFYADFTQRNYQRQPAEEFLLVQQWAKTLGLSDNFELENETQYEAKSDIDSFINQLQQDPFGLASTEDLLQKREMEQFQKHQEEIGTNMAIVLFMVEALQHFKEKTTADIKQAAFEIAMLGMQGIDPNKKDYIISSVTGKHFSGNQVLAFYYVSWALAMPEQVDKLGLPFENEFLLAKTMTSG